MFFLLDCINKPDTVHQCSMQNKIHFVGLVHLLQLGFLTLDYFETNRKCFSLKLYSSTPILTLYLTYMLYKCAGCSIPGAYSMAIMSALSSRKFS